MKQVFADTLYWVASITPGDPWHAPTLRAVAALGPVHLVTTEEVLVEFLSAYAGRGAYLRGKAKNDKSDSPKIAVLLRGGMLPQA